MFALSPWTLARRAAGGRRTLLLFVVAALLYGFGLHAARACLPAAGTATHAHAAQSGGHPCSDEVDLAQAACETHCQSDAQSGRALIGFDLPAAAPPNLAASLAPPKPSGPHARGAAQLRRDSGPPLHIVLHRLLR
jgi:hypothetical protein